MEKFLAEGLTPKQVVAPISVASARTGERVSMVDAKRVTFLVVVGAGSSTDAHSVVLQQHTLGSGGVSHDLAVDHPYYHKVGNADAFTKVEVASALATYDLHSLVGQNAHVVAFEVLAEDLRSDCTHVSLDTGATNGTQIGAVLALVDGKFKPAYAQEV